MAAIERSDSDGEREVERVLVGCECEVLGCDAAGAEASIGDLISGVPLDQGYAFG